MLTTCFRWHRPWRASDPIRWVCVSSVPRSTADRTSQQAQGGLKGWRLSAISRFRGGVWCLLCPKGRRTWPRSLRFPPIPDDEENNVTPPRNIEKFHCTQAWNPLRTLAPSQSSSGRIVGGYSEYFRNPHLRSVKAPIKRPRPFLKVSRGNMKRCLLTDNDGH